MSQPWAFALDKQALYNQQLWLEQTMVKMALLVKRGRAILIVHCLLLFGRGDYS